MNENGHPLLFPALIRLGRNLLCCPKEITKVSGFRHIGANRFTVTEPKGLDFFWMIDAEGNYRGFLEIKRTSIIPIPKALKSIINFTKIEYEITDPKKISVSELKAKIKGTKGKERKELEKVLSNYSDEILVSQEMFLYEYMNERSNCEIERYP